MEQIKNKLFDTDVLCICGGTIMESVSLKSQQRDSTWILGDQSIETRWVDSDYISCQTCGLQYGQPKFNSVLANKELKETLLWELSLIKAVTRHQLTEKDFSTWKLIRSHSTEGVQSNLHLFPEGTVVYIETSTPRYFLASKTAQCVRLSKKQSAQVYIINNESLV